MKKSWLIFLFGLMIAGCVSLIIGWTSIAQTPTETFEVIVSPSSFQINESVDVTITAKKNGQVNTAYTGMVYLTIKDWANELAPSERVLPTHWRYQFLPSDLWTKTFSKGVTVKKVGNFTFFVSNFEQTIVGSAPISLVWETSSPSSKSVTILSPAPYGREEKSTVTLIATAPDLPNGYASVYLNWRVVGNAIVDQDGTIQYTLSNLLSWENTVFIVVTDATDQEVGRSEEVVFVYDAEQGELFKTITITPQEDIRLGDQITFEVETADSITDVSLVLSNGQPAVPMTKKAGRDGEFTKQLMMISTGTITVDLILSIGNQTFSQTGVASLVVGDETLISDVQMLALDLQKLSMKWEVSGIPTSWFQIKYGEDKMNLTQSVTIAQTGLIFSGLDTTKDWFFQIVPIYGPLTGVQEPILGVSTGTVSFSLWDQPHGTPSQLFWYQPGVSSGDILSFSGELPSDIIILDSSSRGASFCVIQWIRVTTKKEGGKHYLVRDAVENAKFYTIYTSDTDDPTTKRKLLDTTETQYEYPFDYNAKEDIYAYFRVEATCDDGQTLDLAGATKAHVGPVEDVLLLVFVSLLIYGGIKLYRYSE